MKPQPMPKGEKYAYIILLVVLLYVAIKTIIDLSTSYQ
jgi:cell division protein FtsL